MSLVENTTYQWCACGLTETRPWCDGHHAATAITPVAFTATRSRKHYICGCGATATPPLCDGSHSRLGHDHSV